MADTTDRNERHDEAEDNPKDLNRLTPRSVDPEHRDSVGGASTGQATSSDSGRSIRPDPIVEETAGGDIAGVAGGGIDSNVSGLGGDKDRR
jgi:hypothetical protein